MSPDTHPPVPEKHYDLVLTQPHFAEWLARLQTAELIAFDCETTSPGSDAR